MSNAVKRLLALGVLRRGKQKEGAALHARRRLYKREILALLPMFFTKSRKILFKTVDCTLDQRQLPSTAQEPSSHLEGPEGKHEGNHAEKPKDQLNRLSYYFSRVQLSDHNNKSQNLQAWRAATAFPRGAPSGNVYSTRAIEFKK